MTILDVRGAEKKPGGMIALHTDAGPFSRPRKATGLPRKSA